MGSRDTSAQPAPAVDATQEAEITPSELATATVATTDADIDVSLAGNETETGFAEGFASFDQTTASETVLTATPDEGADPVEVRAEGAGTINADGTATLDGVELGAEENLQDSALRGSEAQGSGTAGTGTDTAVTGEQEREFGSHVAGEIRLEPGEEPVATPPAPEPTRTIDLDQAEKDMRDALHTSWKNWNVEEDKFIRTLLSVPDHQLDQLMDKFGGKSEFMELVRSKNAFNGNEIDTIESKLFFNPDQVAPLVQDLMTDYTLMDGVDPDRAIEIISALSDEQLSQVMERFTTDEMLTAADKEFTTVQKVKLVTELTRVDAEQYHKLAELIETELSKDAGQRSQAVRNAIFESLKHTDFDQLSSAYSEVAQRELGADLLKATAHMPSRQQEVLKLMFGPERGQIVFDVRQSLKEKKIDGFVEAVSELPPEQRKQFREDFEKSFGPTMGTIEQAVTTAYKKNRTDWANAIRAIDPNTKITPERMNALSPGQYDEVTSFVANKPLLEELGLLNPAVVAPVTPEQVVEEAVAVDAPAAEEPVQQEAVAAPAADIEPTPEEDVDTELTTTPEPEPVPDEEITTRISLDELKANPGRIKNNEFLRGVTEEYLAIRYEEDPEQAAQMLLDLRTKISESIDNDTDSVLKSVEETEKNWKPRNEYQGEVKREVLSLLNGEGEVTLSNIQTDKDFDLESLENFGPGPIDELDPQIS